MLHMLAAQVAGIALVAMTSIADAATADTWGQCGGIGWSGPTDCPSGWCCYQGVNSYYAQCTTGTACGGVATASATGAAPHVPSNGMHTTQQAATSTASQAASKLSMSTVVSKPVVQKSANPQHSSAPSSSPAAASPPKSSSPAAPAAPPKAAGTGVSYLSSFTKYGAGDTFGSGNCQTATAACGFYTSPGFSAAVSQNLYGAKAGQGAGPACGTCWNLTLISNSQGVKTSNTGNSIVVKVNNLCPVEGNPLCSQPTLGSMNSLGANVNFDTCIDSGASDALFGDSGTGLGTGFAQEVDCTGNYVGTEVK